MTLLLSPYILWWKRWYFPKKRRLLCLYWLDHTPQRCRRWLKAINLSHLRLHYTTNTIPDIHSVIIKVLINTSIKVSIRQISVRDIFIMISVIIIIIIWSSRFGVMQWIILRFFHLDIKIKETDVNVSLSAVIVIFIEMVT